MMRQGTLWAALLLSPVLTGCVGGQVEYTQAGMDDLRAVGIEMEGVSQTWSPEAQHGQGIALQALLTLYPAEPDPNGTNLSSAEAQRLIDQHESVHLELVDEPSIVLAEEHNQTDREIQTVHFLFENGTDRAAETEILVCGEEMCTPWTTSESFDNLRAQAEQAAEAVKES